MGVGLQEDGCFMTETRLFRGRRLRVEERLACGGVKSEAGQTESETSAG